MLVAALLGGCSSTGNLTPQLLVGGTAKEEMSPATLREHERILAAYGGAYNDQKLEALINQTVDKLVAASDRPDVKYRVTILNSPAINAFALPGGQLYVTRGLIALANDTSELASVLSHEMAHVIASHAAIREDQARQVALVEPRGQRRAERSRYRGAGAGEIQDRAGELLARAGIRGRRHRRRDCRARRLRSLWRGALPHLDGPQCRTRPVPTMTASIRGRSISSPRIPRRRSG